MVVRRSSSRRRRSRSSGSTGSSSSSSIGPSLALFVNDRGLPCMPCVFTRFQIVVEICSGHTERLGAAQWLAYKCLILRACTRSPWPRYTSILSACAMRKFYDRLSGRKLSGVLRVRFFEGGGTFLVVCVRTLSLQRMTKPASVYAQVAPSGLSSQSP